MNKNQYIFGDLKIMVMLFIVMLLVACGDQKSLGTEADTVYLASRKCMKWHLKMHSHLPSLQ